MGVLQHPNCRSDSGTYETHLRHRLTPCDQADAAQSAAPPVAACSASGFIKKRITARSVPGYRVVVESGIADTVVRRARTNLQSDQRRGGGLRGRIRKFSRASAQRLLLTARNLPDLSVMLTLTYPAEFPTDGRRVKANWTAFRKFLCRRGASVGLWFLEFQKRGAPHYHVFLTTRVDREAVSAAWYRIVGSGDPAHLVAGTCIEYLRQRKAAACYASKYAVKAEQKEVPAEYSKVGRFWGVWGAPDLWKVHSLSRKTGTTLLRYLRRLYKAKRRAWLYQRKRFKDKGHAGFVAWSVGADSFERAHSSARGYARA